MRYELENYNERKKESESFLSGIRVLCGDILRDLHYAFRTLLKRPVFAFAIITIFALGTGVNTAIYSLAYTILVQPLPYPDPDRLVRLWEVEKSSPRDLQMTSISNLLDWRMRNRTLEGIAAWKRPTSTTLTGQEQAEEVQAASVTSNFFSILKVDAFRGRTFLAEDDRQSARVVVVSHAFWKSHLGERSDVVGSRIELDQEPFTIVGILPAKFTSPSGKADVWVPTSLRVNSIDRGQNYMQVFARMKPGVTHEQSQSDVAAVASALEKEYPASNLGHGIVLIPMQTQMTSALRTPLMILFATVTVVLLIACLNISNLLVVRGFDRRREFLIRMALGGSRMQVIRQLLTENLILFFAGGVAGMILSRWMLRGLLLLEPELLPEAFLLHMKWENFAIGLAISLFTGFLFGLAPAIQFRRKVLGNVLKKEERGLSGDRFLAILRQSFVILQIAFSLCLISSAVLLVRSFVAMRETPSGFNSDSVLIAQQAIDGENYIESRSKSGYYKNLIEQLKRIPGVTNAAASTVIPMGEFGIDFQVPYTRDRDLPAISVAPQAYFRAVTPDYFKTLQIPLLQGRDFTKDDHDSSPLAVIVNETLAKKTWPGENPVGKKLRFFWADWQTYTVVGLVANTLSYGKTAGPVAELYVPDAQIPYSVMNVVVRFHALTEGSGDQVRKTFLTSDPLQPVQDIVTMKSQIDRSMRSERLVAFLVSVFGILAILLASAGIYGTISFAVSRRTPEIGLRMALGATRGQVRNWIFKLGAGLLIPGILIGSAGAVIASSFLRKFLYGTSFDPVTLALSTAALCLTGWLACFIPARRAAALDPNVALHYE